MHITIILFIYTLFEVVVGGESEGDTGHSEREMRSFFVIVLLLKKSALKCMGYW